MRQLALQLPASHRVLVAAVALLVVLAGTVAAQQTTPPAGASCQLGPISYVFIDNRSIFDPHDVETARWPFGFLFRAANTLHIRTRRSVIARELLFGPGDCYDPVLVEESERVLR